MMEESECSPIIAIRCAFLLIEQLQRKLPFSSRLPRGCNGAELVSIGVIQLAWIA